MDDQLHPEDGPASRFCTFCGHKMNVAKSEDHSYYDPRSGARIVNWLYWWRCPKKEMPWDKHDTQSNTFGGNM